MLEVYHITRVPEIPSVTVTTTGQGAAYPIHRIGDEPRTAPR
jgi:hypothetical protein